MVSDATVYVILEKIHQVLGDYLMSYSRLILLLLIAFVIAIPTAVTAFAENNADDILGDWIYTDGPKQVKINIFKRDNKYYGKLVWLKEPNDETGKPKTDKFNPDPSLRSRPLLGLEILRDFVFDGDDTWESGRIYKTDEGSDYKCKMWFKDERTLYVKGYIGISIIGKTKEFTRPVEWKPAK